MGAGIRLLQEISSKEYVEKIAAVAGKNFNSLVWMEKATGKTLAFMFCSELGIGILKIRKVSPGKSVSNFYTGSFNDVVKVWRSSASFSATTSRKS